MKIRTTIYIILALFVILPYIGAATPGINVTVDPSSRDAQSGTTIDYVVKIENLDQDYYKNITSIDMEILPTGWTYSIDQLTTTILPAGEGSFITTTLHITIPLGTGTDIYNHRINVSAEFELYPGCSLIESDPSICFLPENDPEDFNTHVIASTAPIPEFPTVALPIISAMGIMLIMSRRKDRR